MWAGPLIRRMPPKPKKTGGAEASLAALTGLDMEAAATLLEATGGDVEMAVALHFGCEEDEDAYWSDEEDVAGKLLQAELEQSSSAKAAQLISRVEEKHKVADSKGGEAVRRRERKSRASVRGQEAEEEVKALAATPSREGFSCLAVEGSDGGSTDEGTVAASVDEESPSDDDDDWVDEEWEPRLQECLFDGHQSASFEENCGYMQTTHSFHLPFPQYLRDSRGLFAYLQEKMYCYHTCIYCNRVFGDLDAVRKHVKDKSHGKVNFEDDDGALELSEYYDFGKSWMARQAFRRAAFRQRPSNVDAVAQGLILPNGTRVGHRALLQSYRKKSHTSLGLTVRAHRSESHRYYHHRVPAGIGGRGQRQDHALMNAYQDLQARVARREANMQRNMVLVRAAAVAGGNSKALPGQYTFKADFADNAAARAVVHHWGAGGGGSHYHMAGSKQFLKGVRVRGVVSRHSRQGARLEASRQAARTRKAQRGSKAHADNRS